MLVLLKDMVSLPNEPRYCPFSAHIKWHKACETKKNKKYTAVLSSSFKTPSHDVEQEHPLCPTYDQLFDGCSCRICL